MRTAWSLPGPTSLIRRVLTSLLDVRVKTLHVPRDARGLVEALQAGLLNRGYPVLVFDLPAPGSFLAEPAERLAASNTADAVVLARDPGLRGVIVLMLTEGPLEPDLQAFARQLRRCRDAEGPSLIIVTQDGAGRLEDVTIESVRNAIDPLDGAAYAAWLPRQENPLVGQMVASVAIEVAAWDVALLDHLTALPAPKAIRPDLHVSAWDGGRAQTCRGSVASWENGMIDNWGGEDAAHPIWLAANRPTLLTKRVWRGQLAILLPWIELHRLRIIDRHRSRLSVGRLSEDVDVLDWGPLVFQLRAFDAKLAQAAEPFRIARNELAHGRAVDWTAMSACLRNASRLDVYPKASANAPTSSSVL